MRPPGTFQERLGIFQGPPGTRENLKTPVFAPLIGPSLGPFELETFRDLQVPFRTLSGTSRDFWGPLRAFSDLQGPLGTFQIFQGPLGTFMDLLGTFSDI